jgi:hypothetical protein
LNASLEKLQGAERLQLVEHVVSQPKVRELFKLNTYRVDNLIDKLLSLTKQPHPDPDANEKYTRLLSHLAFCQQPVSDVTMTKLVFSLTQSSFSGQRETLKWQKASINCISNLLQTEMPLAKPIVDSLETWYRRLKELMLQITKKLSLNHKSKKNIIYMTTVIRAF